MKAIVFTKYGNPEVLKLQETDIPVLKENEILVKIKATAVNSGDLRLRKADPFAVRFMTGLFRPKIKILGSVYSGEVSATGKNVGAFNSGDLVFGHTDMKFGAYAEYICVPESATVALKPGNFTHEEAASVPFGALTALFWIKKLNIQPQQKVLIYGASGAVGTAAIQLAKAAGAEITAVCSKENQELVKELGADKTIDYRTENLSTHNEKYDFIIETVNKSEVSDCFNSLKSGGTLVLSAAMLKQMVKGKMLSGKDGKKVLSGIIAHNAEGIQSVKRLCEEGKYKPVIDSVYPFEDMRKAHAYAEKGHKKGNVVVTI